jgi:hypothetical protein
VENAVPVNGDRVAFGPSSQSQGTNDIGGLTLEGIEIDPLSITLWMYGSPVALTGASAVKAMGGGSANLMFPISLGPNASIIALDGDGGSPTMRLGSLTLGGGTTTISSPSLVAVDSILESAPSSLTVRAKSFQLNDSYALTGDFVFSGDSLFPSGSLGSRTASITANTLDFVVPAGHEVVSTPLRLGSSGGDMVFTTNATKPMRFTAPMELTGGDYVAALYSDTTFEGPISGNGSLVVLAGAPLTLSSGSNTFTGSVLVADGGKLVLAGTGSLPAQDALQVKSGGWVKLASGTQTTYDFYCKGMYEVTMGAILRAVYQADIDGCALKVDVPPGYAWGDDPVTILSVGNGSFGTFAGLPEHSPITIGGTTRYITYRAGSSGGDIALLSTGPGSLPSPGDSKTGMWWGGAS